MISLSLKHLDEHYLELSIRDNGVGISGDLNELNFKSLGMKLIPGFSTDLDSKLLIVNDNRLLIDIKFRHHQ